MSVTQAEPVAQGLDLDSLARWPRRILRGLDRVLAGRWWLVKVVFLTALISVVAAAPTYENFKPRGKDWAAIERMADHPFDQEGLDPTDRSYNFTFRVTVPIVGGVLGLGPAGYLVLQGLAGLGLFAATALAVERISANRRIAALSAIGVGLTWAGACAFVEVRGNFDAVAIALLVGAMATRRVALVTVGCFLAAWTDERAIPVVAFVMLFQHFAESRDVTWRTAWKEPRVLAAAAGIALHFVTRFAAAAAFDVQQPSNLGLTYVEEQMSILPIGLWTGLEGFWLVVAAAAVILWQAGQRLIMVAYVGLIATIGVGSIAVVDVTRSMAYLFPAALAGAAVLARLAKPSVLRGATYLGFALTAAWPLYYAGGAFTLYWVYPAPLALLRDALGVG